MSKNVSFSHLAIPVRDAGKSIAFYEKYVEMKVVRTRENPVNVWLSDGVRPFQIALLEEHEDDGSHHGTLIHPITPSAHMGFTCKSVAEVDRRAAMAKAEGILTYGPVNEGWPGGYVCLIRDPDGHSVELSFNQEGQYALLLDPCTDLNALENHKQDGQLD